MLIRVIKILCVLLCVVSCTNNSPSEQFTVGIVNPLAMRDPVIESFQAGLAELGYIEDKNIQYLYEGAIPDAEARAEWVQKLVAANVDLIVGIATPGAISAKEGTDAIPIIFFPVTDPVGAGLVESLQAPNSNATGITNGNPHPLRLQFLLQLDPGIKTIYAPLDTESPPATATLPSILAVAEELGIELLMPVVQSNAAIEEAIANIPDEADAIFIMPDPLIASYWQAWSEAATERGIPFSSLSLSEVERGALMAYGEELDAVGKQGARMADVILHGTAPSDMPVETADFFLSINLETAALIDLNVPDSILQRATFIIYPEGQDGS